MSVYTLGLVAWLTATLVIVLLPIVVATARIYVRRSRDGGSTHAPASPVEVLVPLRGVVPNQEAILESFLRQDHPSYCVSFIVESETDPANVIVDRLCGRYARTRKLVAGLSQGCAQKNHNLIAGVRSLRPQTDIIVFCDSTNMVRGDWLVRFTQPIEAGQADVVTTFRSFKPVPESIAGVAQAIYASWLLCLITLQPKPWGGATAIRRKTLEKLGVLETWSRTVVDDLVLGNILEAAGIAVRVDTGLVLTSPVNRQTIRGFLDYLDRQILFPKYTNPGIWFAALLGHLNLTAASAVAGIAVVLSVAGLVGTAAGLAGMGFLVGLSIISLAMRRISVVSISVGRWLLALYPCIFLAAFIFLRSIARNYIIWHGRTYWPGPGGVVLETTNLAD